MRQAGHDIRKSPKRNQGNGDGDEAESEVNQGNVDGDEYESEVYQGNGDGR